MFLTCQARTSIAVGGGNLGPQVYLFLVAMIYEAAIGSYF